MFCEKKSDTPSYRPAECDYGLITLKQEKGFGEFVALRLLSITSQTILKTIHAHVECVLETTTQSGCCKLTMYTMRPNSAQIFLLK